jgi:hypothetical protein
VGVHAIVVVVVDFQRGDVERERHPFGTEVREKGKEGLPKSTDRTVLRWNLGEKEKKTNFANRLDNNQGKATLSSKENGGVFRDVRLADSTHVVATETETARVQL